LIYDGISAFVLDCSNELEEWIHFPVLSTVSFCCLGATRGESPADIASKNKLIVTMLPSSPNVAAVYTGENGILRFIYSLMHTYI